MSYAGMGQTIMDVVAASPVAMPNQFATMSPDQLFNAAMLDSSSAFAELTRRAHGNDPAVMAALARIGQARAMFSSGTPMDQIRARFGVTVPTLTAPTRPIGGIIARTVAATPSSSIPIANAMMAKANVDRLFRTYQTTSPMDALKRNSVRQSQLAAGRSMVQLLQRVRPVTESERLRLRAIMAGALASSQMRQQCFSSGANGCRTFLMNEDQGPAKTNAEFVAITRPLDALLRLSNVRPIATPRVVALPTVVIVQGVRLAIPTTVPANAQVIVAAAAEAAAVAAAKLAADVKVAQAVTNAATRAAADKVVAAQAAADAAAKAAEEQAAKAKAAAEAAAQATVTAQTTGTTAAVQTAQVAAQTAEVAHVAAEQASVAATEVATVADVARSELEVAATVTNDAPAQEASTAATMTVAVETTGLGPLGVSWKVWGLGAAVLVGGYLFMNSRAVSKNRRRVRRNRRRR